MYRERRAHADVTNAWRFLTIRPVLDEAVYSIEVRE